MRFWRSAPARADNLRGITHGGVVAEGQELRHARGARAGTSGMTIVRVAAATFIAFRPSFALGPKALQCLIAPPPPS